VEFRPEGMFQAGVVFQAKVASQAEVALWAEVASALKLAVCIGQVEVGQCLCLSIVSTGSLKCQFGKGGIQPCSFDEA